MSFELSELRVIPAAEDAVLVEYPSLEAVLAHYAGLRTSAIYGVRELVPAARTIAIYFHPALITPSELAAAVRSVDPMEVGQRDSAPVEIEVLYDGEDLAEVSDLLGVSTEELVARHQAAAWRVAFVGFAPGFAYCVGDDELFSATPRRTTPRPRIPAGSVGLAANFSAVYPGESPGGWQLIGRTAAPMWDVTREKPALLGPGDTVKYRAVREAIRIPAPAPETPSEPERYLEVINPGVQLVIEDFGREGLLDVGVAASGAADRGSLAAANHAVGNEMNAPAIEISGGGVELLSHARCEIAVAGARGEMKVTEAETGYSFPLRPGMPAAIEPGDSISIGWFSCGLRTYLAVRGGLDVAPVLGSCSRDTLAGLGPEPLLAGTKIALADGARGVVVDQPIPGTDLPDADIVTLELDLGPRTDWFSAEALKTLTAQTWEVTPQSDRVGIRLEAETPLERSRTEELKSEGVVTGAVQVPNSGQPVIFLADHPLTGGYPVIGSLAREDLDVASQLKPGSGIRFRVRTPFREY